VAVLSNVPGRHDRLAGADPGLAHGLADRLVLLGLLPGHQSQVVRQIDRVGARRGRLLLGTGDLDHPPAAATHRPPP
jgi:hypothetical protein